MGEETATNLVDSPYISALQPFSQIGIPRIIGKSLVNPPQIQSSSTHSPVEQSQIAIHAGRTNLAESA